MKCPRIQMEDILVIENYFCLFTPSLLPHPVLDFSIFKCVFTFSWALHSGSSQAGFSPSPDCVASDDVCTLLVCSFLERSSLRISKAQFPLPVVEKGTLSSVQPNFSLLPTGGFCETHTAS